MIGIFWGVNCFFVFFNKKWICGFNKIVIGFFVLIIFCVFVIGKVVIIKGIWCFFIIFIILLIIIFVDIFVL